MDIAVIYHVFKDGIVHATGQSDALLYVNSGLAIYLAFMAALGTCQASRPALTLVALLMIFDQTMAVAYSGHWQVAQGLGNLALAEMWPCLLVAVNRYRRTRWSAERAKIKPQRPTPTPPTLGGALLHGRFRVIEGRG